MSELIRVDFETIGRLTGLGQPNRVLVFTEGDNIIPLHRHPQFYDRVWQQMEDLAREYKVTKTALMAVIKETGNSNDYLESKLTYLSERIENIRLFFE